MGFPRSCSNRFIFLFVLMMVDGNFAELIVLPHSPSHNLSKRKFTCISEDDGSALIWNSSANKRKYNNFSSNRLMPRNFTNCGIYGSSSCIAEWSNINGWNIVHSVNHSMSPVFDYRWEGFEELVFNKDIEKQEYKYIREWNGYSNTIIFSVRGWRNFNIFLCQDKDPTRSPCFWIILEPPNDKPSEIWNCEKGVPESYQSASTFCKDGINTTGNGKFDGIALYEWRTFRIEWSNEYKTIEIFRDNETESFLSKKFKNLHSISHLLSKSEKVSQVKFHFYEYLRTQKVDAELLTLEFIQRSQNFCMELLVGLCPNCGLRLYFMDRRGMNITNKEIYSETASVNSVHISWQTTILNVSLPSFSTRKLYLKVVSFLRHSNLNRGAEWAIGNFRTCDQVGQFRESTITVREQRPGNSTWPELRCQKLSNNQRSTVVNSISTVKIRDSMELRSLQLFLQGWLKSCGSLCKEFHKYWSLCNSNGCTCDPNFEEKCCFDSSYSEYWGCKTCIVKDNQESQHCENKMLLPPVCQKELEMPQIINVTSTTAKFRQKIDFKIDTTNDSPTLFIKGVRQRVVVNLVKNERDVIYEANIKNLDPQCEYTVYLYGTIGIANQTIEISGPKVSFTTKSTLESCFNVIPQERSLTVQPRNESQECKELFSMQLNFQLEIKDLNGTHITPRAVPRLPENISENIMPDTVYTVQIHIRGQKVWTKNVSTLGTAPMEVKNLSHVFLSDTEVTVTWTAPYNTNGMIKKYIIRLEREELLGCTDLGEMTPPEVAISRQVNVTEVYFDGLNPYAKYVVTVNPYTSNRGSKVSLSFETMESVVPTSVVSNLRFNSNQSRLEWDDPDDCTTVSGPKKSETKKLVFQDINNLTNTLSFDTKANSNYSDLKGLNLVPYTSYRIRVFVMGSHKRVNETLYQEINWTTPPAAPPAPRNLQIYNADPDEKSISISWLPPDPPHGEIEYYNVLIHRKMEKKDYNVNKTIIPSEEMSMCESQGNLHVCCEDLRPFLDDESNVEAMIQVYGKNKGVKEFGKSANLSFVLNEKYNQAPGTPRKLNVTKDDYGVVTLVWEHPSYSPTKIKKFRIFVHFIDTKLLGNTNGQNSSIKNYTVEKYQHEYFMTMSLLPSTNYNISIVSVNLRDITSLPINLNYSVASSIGFVRDEKPQLNFNGTCVKIDIPTVLNATVNTTLKVIIKGPSICTLNDQQQSSSSIASDEFVLTAWDLAFFGVMTNMSRFLNSSANRIKGVTETCSLNPEERYTLEYVVTDEFSKKFQTLTVLAISQKFDPTWLIVLTIILGSCFILISVWYRRKYRVAPLKTNPNDILTLEPLRIEDSTALCTQKLETPQPNITSNQIPIDLCSPDVQPSNDINSYPVKVEEFETYAKKALASGLLDSQYRNIPKDLMKLCEYATLPENVIKNRYKDRIPYDETRVILDEIPGEPNSDYINASYIQGYRKKKAYIATQGPKQKTIKDFWRMIWQENVRVICMLANVTEGGKKKCEQYWPELGTKMRYGNILISNTKNSIYADYTFRTFKLNCEKEAREVTHLHFTGWPDHGVPMYTQSLVAYLKKLLGTYSGNAPIVVHCSAGVGRTGTIILCDICLRQAVAERIIDVPSVTIRMREDRPNMIDNAQQYLLAHLAIVESMIVEQTQIRCDNSFSSKIIQLRKQLPSDIKRLKDVVWQDRALHSLETPGHQSQGTLETEKSSKMDSDKKNVIDTVNVDGAKMKDQYVAVRLPSTSDLPEFWKLIRDKNIELVVILQDPSTNDSTSCGIVSTESIFYPVPNIQIQRKTSLEKREHFTIDKLLLTDLSQRDELRQLPVTVLKCTGWKCGKRGKPPNPSALVSLWMASEKIQRQEGQTLVVCLDGITGCGLYLALSFLLERISVEGECDVISSVRGIRRSKPEFVKSLEQFKYLYDAAENYVEYFNIYANFT